MDTIIIELNAQARGTMDAVDLVASWHRLAPLIATTMALQDEASVAWIQANRLSEPGQFTLGVRSGRLYKSLRPRKTVIAGNAVISGIGSNVRYLAAHEFGFHGTVQVKAHTRRYARMASIYHRLMPVPIKDAEALARRSKKVNAKLKFGQSQVKAHSRQVDIPARAPLAAGTVDRMDEISEAVSDTIVDAFKVGGEFNPTGGTHA